MCLDYRVEQLGRQTKNLFTSKPLSKIPKDMFATKDKVYHPKKLDKSSHVELGDVGIMPSP